MQPFSTPRLDDDSRYDRTLADTEALDASVLATLTDALVLQGERGAGEGQRFPLLGATLFIGRDPDCDVLLVHPTIGRRHAKLRCLGTRVLIRDLGSQNGTYVNGARLTPDSEMELRRGDVLVMGNARLRLTSAEPSTTGISSVRTMPHSQPQTLRVALAGGVAMVVALVVGVVALGRPSVTFQPLAEPAAEQTVEVRPPTPAPRRESPRERFEAISRAAYQAVAAKDRLAAMEHFLEALELDESLQTGRREELGRSLAGLYTIEGLELARRGESVQAVASLRIALKYDPKNALAQRRLGALLNAPTSPRPEADVKPLQSSARRTRAALDEAFDSDD